MARSIEQKRSRRQEQNTAKEVNGCIIPASGSRWHSKGDIRSDKFLIECKTTAKDCYRLTAKTWEKIAKEALRDGIREPVMRLDLRTAHGDVTSFAVMYAWAYDKLRTLDLGGDYFTFIQHQGEHGSYLIKTGHAAEIARFMFICKKYPAVISQVYDVAVFSWGLFLNYINDV